MTVTLVAAVARGGVIGRDGGIPWQLPEDMAHFQGADDRATRSSWAGERGSRFPIAFVRCPGGATSWSRGTGVGAEGAERAGSLDEALGSSTAKRTCS